MKILNDIACNLNCIQILKFDSNTLKFNWKKRWDANWYINYWKSSFNYNVEKKPLKKHKSKITPCHSSFFGNQLNIFQFGTFQKTIHTKRQLIKVVICKLFLLNNYHWNYDSSKGQ
jgi:hypothetical protein